MKRELENFIEKMIAFCENPFIFINYPISEEAASMFELSRENQGVKDNLFEIVQEFKILETKLVPACMSRNKFNLIFFLVTADYQMIQKKWQDESLSTNDTVALDKSGIEASGFLKEEGRRVGVSDGFFVELGESIAEAFSQCEINEGWCLD